MHSSACIESGSNSKAWIGSAVVSNAIKILVITIIIIIFFCNAALPILLLLFLLVVSPCLQSAGICATRQAAYNAVMLGHDYNS